MSFGEHEHADGAPATSSAIAMKAPGAVSMVESHRNVLAIRRYESTLEATSESRKPDRPDRPSEPVGAPPPCYHAHVRVRDPQVLKRGSDRAAIREDIRPYVGTTVEDRVRIAEALCAFAAEQIAARADGARVLAYRDPLTAQSLATWKALVARYRRQDRPSP